MSLKNGSFTAMFNTVIFFIVLSVTAVPLVNSAETRADTEINSSLSVAVHARAQGLADHFMLKNKAEKLTWDWGPAFFLYGLSRYLPTVSDLKQANYIKYIDTYHSAYSDIRNSKKLPEINWSDRCPSALSALRLEQDHQISTGMTAAIKVADYVKNEPRNALGTLDHLGHRLFKAKFYPNSMWVDSLVMYAVFAAQWAQYTNNSALMDFAASQPLIFASVLQDEDSHLFRHAYDVKKSRLIPRRAGGFWLRGNGWVLTSILEILDALPEDHVKRAQLIQLFQSVAEGALSYQKSNGLWSTIMNRPNYYEETSGSAIFAYAFAKGARLGYLDARFKQASERTMIGLERYVQEITAGESKNQSDRLFSMSGISWWTIPGPDWLYRWMPRKRDLPYGIGAYLLAATEY